MTVKELMDQLKEMPQNAKLLAYQPDAGCFVQLKSLKLEDGKSFGRKDEMLVLFYDKPLKKEPKEPVEEQVENLCPECSFYCQERFIDGICK